MRAIINCKLPVYNNYISYHNTVVAIITQSHNYIHSIFSFLHSIFFFSGEMQLHLQAMVNLLRDEDVLRLVRLTMIVSVFVMYIHCTVNRYNLLFFIGSGINISEQPS